ncbi:MAG TPA: hypothetical protein VIM77_08975, partial [Mucilaginibacter sp.]
IQQVIYRTLLASFIVNLFLNLCFYPSLLHYQAGSEAAIWINSHNAGNLPVYTDAGQFHDDFNFYLNANAVEIKPDMAANEHQPAIIYINSNDLKIYTQKGFDVKLLKTFKTYPVTRLSPNFLNKATRSKELYEMALAIISQAKK